MALSIPSSQALSSYPCLLVQQDTMCIRSLVLTIYSKRKEIDLCSKIKGTANITRNADL